MAVVWIGDNSPSRDPRRSLVTGIRWAFSLSAFLWTVIILVVRALL